jgi:uncharacterized protein DUF3313
MNSNKQGRATRHIVALALVAVTLSATGCGLIWPTRERRDVPVQSGFLGDYSGLSAKQGAAVQEVYINPAAAWSNYNAIHIDSVSLWASGDSPTPSAADQQMLTNMLYQSMHDKLAEKFTLVDHPGPGVIRVRMALTQVKGARVALNAITTVIPQLRLVTTLGGVAADTAVLVGSASAEMEVTDSMTNERLAAGVDSRAGTKGLARAFSKWADVQAICDYWAEHARDFFVKEGVRPKA